LCPSPCCFSLFLPGAIWSFPSSTNFLFKIYKCNYSETEGVNRKLAAKSFTEAKQRTQPFLSV
jgi:hypothetical protein